MPSQSPFREPSLVVEPFVLGGQTDPVSWFDVQERSDVALDFLVDIGYKFEARTEVKFCLIGTEVVVKQAFFRLHGGAAYEEPLPALGWVPEGIMYIIASLGTEIRLIQQLQATAKPEDRDLPEISQACYAYRLREYIIRTIPEGNRRETGPRLPHPPCHGYTCWLARTTSRLPHNVSGREIFMSAFPTADFEMYSVLVADLGRIKFSWFPRRFPGLTGCRFSGRHAYRAGLHLVWTVVWDLQHHRAERPTPSTEGVGRYSDREPRDLGCLQRRLSRIPLGCEACIGGGLRDAATLVRDAAAFKDSDHQPQVEGWLFSVPDIR